MGTVRPQPYVISEPHTRAIKLGEGATHSLAAAGLLLACDGVFDVFTPAEAAAVCLAEPDVARAAEALCDAALAAGSRDNVSAVVVRGLGQLRGADEPAVDGASALRFLRRATAHPHGR